MIPDGVWDASFFWRNEISERPGEIYSRHFSCSITRLQKVACACDTPRLFFHCRINHV
jgi:hypothetical protein